MTPMSHDPAAAVIGAQTIEIGARALAASASAAPSVTALAPAGAEEVSAQHRWRLRRRPQRCSRRTRRRNRN